MMRSLPVLLVLSAIASPASADVVDHAAPEAPGYQVHVVGMDAFADRAFVNVRSRPPVSHGDQPSRIASYVLVNDFPIDFPERLCAVPSSSVIDSPVGGLGTRMVQGARGASGAVVTDDTGVTELLALFEGPEVACAQPFAIPGIDPALSARGVERIQDTVRVATVDGRTIGLELVEVEYQLRGGGLVTVPAPPGATSRPPLPPPLPSGCACRVAATNEHGAAAFVLSLVVLGLHLRRARRREA